MAPRFLIFLIIGLCQVDAQSSYPATYPFDAELITFNRSIFPASMPDKTLSKTDPGGYFYQELGNNIFDGQNGSPIPWGMRSGYFWYDDYICSGMYGITCSSLPWSYWNGSNPIFTQNFFSQYSLVDGQQIGTPATSCKRYVGMLSFGFAPQATAQIKNYAAYIPTYACSMWDEQSYCQVAMLNQWYDYNNVISPSVRKIIWACPDIFYRWALTCKLPLATHTAKAEPPLYATKVSGAGSALIFTLCTAANDKVCYPYSYFYGGGKQQLSQPTSVPSSASKFDTVFFISISVLMISLIQL